MKPSALIFDSGVGGLSILQEVRQLLPGLTVHYLMDNAAFPYGLKADGVLIQRVQDVCDTAVAELQPDLLVIACNTASTLTLPFLRQRLSIPVVGVVPAIKTAAAQPGCRRVGLLATPATVNRSYTDRLIAEFASHCDVVRFGSSELVRWAEEYLASGEQPEALYNHLNPWLSGNNAPDHVVLGCTHFPLLRAELERLWPQISWIDSGSAIARRVASLLPAAGRQQQPAPIGCYWTDSHLPAPAGALRFLEKLGTVSRTECLGPDFLIHAPGFV